MSDNFEEAASNPLSVDVSREMLVFKAIAKYGDSDKALMANVAEWIPPRLAVRCFDEEIAEFLVMYIAAAACSLKMEYAQINSTETVQ
jgi:hypothetical protein